MFVLKKIIGSAFCCLCISILMTSTLSAETVRIGVALPLSGDHGSKGKSMLRAIEMNIANLNKAGGINGNKVEIVVKDDMNTPEGAAKAAKEFAAQRDIVAVVGHYYSSALAGAAAIYEQAGIPVVSPFASNSVIAKSKWLFTVNVGDVIQGRFMAVYLNKVMKRDNVVVIHTNENFGQGLKEGFLEKAPRIGLKVNKVIKFDQKTGVGDDFIAKNFPNREANKKVGAIVLLTHSDAGLKLVKQVREQGFACDIFGPHTFGSHKFLTDIDDEYTKDVYVTSPFIWELASERANHFFEAYHVKYKEEPDTVAPMAYDAMLMMTEAIKAKGVKRDEIQKHLVSLKWKTAVDGLSGNLYFEPGRTADRDIYVTEIKNGRFKAAYIQLAVPREPYVFLQKEARLKKGDLIEVDNVLYHFIDVVFVGVDFVRITNVNTVNMTFDAEIFLWYKWTGDKVDTSQFAIVNGVNITSSTLLKEDLTKPVKYRCYRLKVTYLTNYDFSMFPFDTQTLRMTIANKSKNNTHIMCAIDTRHMTHSPINEIFPPEWEFISKKNATGLYRFASTFGDPDYRMGKGYKSRIYFSSANFDVLIKRIIFPYLFTFFIPLGMIMGVVILMCRISIDQFVVRLNATMTATLALLVYHMSQKAVMPKVGYIMKADLYFVCSYIFILLLIAMLVSAQYFIARDKKSIAEMINKRFAFIFIPALLLSYTLVTIL